MYPYQGRLRWLLASPYAHLVAALEDKVPADSLVQDRLAGLRRWNRVRAIVAGLLSLGIVGTASSYFGQINPSLAETATFLQTAAALAGAFTGLLTVIYLFLTRLLNQAQADLLALLVPARPHHAQKNA